MTAARKPNDTIAITAVNLAVSSIGSSPFRLEGGPFPNPRILPAPLDPCQAVFLLHRTIMRGRKVNRTTPHGPSGSRRTGIFFCKSGNSAPSGGGNRLKAGPALEAGPRAPRQKLWRIRVRLKVSAQRVKRRLRDHRAIEGLLQSLDKVALVVRLDVEAVVLIGDAHQVHDAVAAGPGIA